MTRAFVFPGQGSQAIGMGKDLADAFPVARSVFEEVDDALNQKLFKLMQDGPDSDLTLTENAQPALMAVSLAVSGFWKQKAGDPCLIWLNVSPGTVWGNIPPWPRHAHWNWPIRRGC